MGRLAVHILHRGLGLLQPFIGFRPLLQDDGIPYPEVFLGSFQQAQPAIRLNILDRRAAALQTLDALHPVDGFLVEHPAVAAVPLTGQQSLIRVEPQGMLRDAEHLDLLLLHWPFANYYAAWRTLEKLYAEGKVRAIGVSNFEPDQLLDLIAYNKVVPAVNQIETNLYCQRGTERSWMDKRQVAHMAYAPLSQGSRNEMFAEPAVLALAERYGKTPAQVLLRFLTQKGIAVIPRSTRPEHIRENFALFDFTLTPDEMARLSALDKKEPLIGRPETPELVEFSLTW